MNFREQLQYELRDISFSEVQKLDIQRKIINSKTSSSFLNNLWQKVIKFWNGSTEISLPTCAIVLGCMFIGVWQIYAMAFVVDPTLALVLIQTGTVSVQEIIEGVYVL